MNQVSANRNDNDCLYVHIYNEANANNIRNKEKRLMENMRENVHFMKECRLFFRGGDWPLHVTIGDAPSGGYLDVRHLYTTI